MTRAGNVVVAYARLSVSMGWPDDETVDSLVTKFRLTREAAVELVGDERRLAAELEAVNAHDERVRAQGGNR